MGASECVTRRIILHVGTHKTGTSYLQKLFLASRNLFPSLSIHYPSPAHPVLGDHHFLVGCLDEGQDGWSLFFDALATDCQDTLLSSETLLPWLMHSPKAPEFANRLAAYADIQVILYLRRQDFMKESVFAEVATSWYCGTIEDENHYCYDYSFLVDHLVHLFGADALRVGIYRDDRGQDLAADFFHLCGLSHALNQLPVIEPQRVSLDRRLVALMSRFPKGDPALVDRLRTAGLRSLRPDPCKYLWSPQQRRSFLALYRESNRQLAQTYRPDAEAYLVGEDPIDEDWSPPEPYSLQELSALARLLLLPDS